MSMFSKRGRALTAPALMVLTGLALTACGNTGRSDVSILGLTRQAVTQQIAERTGRDEPAAPARSPEQLAAEALRVNPGPLVLVGFERLGRNQVLAMTGQNGRMRTYMTPAEEAVILRDGMLVGTRGLGNDLSVAEPGTEALIRAGRAGRATRVMRYYAGDGQERPLSFDCSTGAGPNAGVIVENCAGHGITFQNSYLVQNGQIPVSRQWVGPVLGHVTIQTLRP